MRGTALLRERRRSEASAIRLEARERATNMRRNFMVGLCLCSKRCSRRG